MRVTIKEIARELGLSHSTVSRVLNDRQSSLVSDATRDRITLAAKQMGYRPNRIAQALKGERTRLIGVLLPDGPDYFFREVLMHLRHTVEEDGFELIPFATPGDQVPASWARLLRWDLDGVLVFDYLFYLDGLNNALLEHSGYVPPMVGLFNSTSVLRDFTAIRFRGAAEALMTHLYEQGCRRIGYVGPQNSFRADEERFAAYDEFVKQQGLQPVHLPISRALTLCEAGYAAVQNHCAAEKTMPDALFCQNDEIALGVCRALHEMGLNIPQDIMVTGCDNVPYMAYLDTPLTTLDLPMREVCQTAWNTLQKRMAEPECAPMQVYLEAVPILRSSTARCRASATMAG